MCGFIGSTSSFHTKKQIQDLLPLIKHRGPDYSGIYSDHAKGYSLSLGHARLSILDLSERSNQPLTLDEGDYTIVFNGEIYNYIELRKSLLQDEKFATQSDTEVLLKLYIKYGKSFLNNLDGMFAFVIYDKKNKSLFCARDQLGIKPFYYFEEDGFVFASEIKPLLGLRRKSLKVSKYALYEYLRNSFVYDPETGFEGVYKLGAGECCEINLTDGTGVVKERYWLPYDSQHNKKYTVPTSFLLNSSDIQNEVYKSIDRQTRSDVPVGLFFSGGVDSSIILTRLKNTVKSFVVSNSKQSIKSSGISNDYKYASEVASIMNVELSELKLEHDTSGENFLKNVKKTAVLCEELISDYTFLASMELAKKSKKNGYTVMLSGMGADEIFGGYSKYKLLIYRRFFSLLSKFSFLYKKIPSLSRKIDRLHNSLAESSFVDRYSSILGYSSKKEVQNSYLFFNSSQEKKYNEKLNGLVKNINNDFKKATYLDIFGFMSHNFTVADKSTMQASVELRVPLATKTLFELSFAKKTSSIIDMFNTKKPLRNILKNYLPKSIINRPKAGFHPPIDQILIDLGEKRLIKEFEQNNLSKLLNENYLSLILREHFSFKKNHALKILQFLYLGYWWSEYFKHDSASN